MRVSRRGAGIGIGAAFAAASTACSGQQAMFDPAGPAADRIAWLGWFLLAICAVVYLAVMAALAVAVVRKRGPDDASPATTRALARRVTWASAATVAVLVGLALVTYAADRGLGMPPPDQALRVDVVGRQWWWDFTYRGDQPQDLVSSPNELHVPVGVPVVLNLIGRDVIHSFWVPNLHGKRDLVPGMATSTWIRADAPGVYRGQCAEFCGLQHANMAFLVVAEPLDRFRAWIAQQRRAASAPDGSAAGDLARRGRDLFLQGSCATCHTVRGTPAAARVGPDLTHVGSRRRLAAGTLPNTPDHLARWVANAQSIKPGTRMPSIPLGDSEREALAAYLRSLQ